MTTPLDLASQLAVDVYRSRRAAKAGAVRG